MSYMKLDPVGSTVRYEIMKLCTGSAQVEFVHAVSAGGSVKFLPAV